MSTVSLPSVPSSPPVPSSDSLLSSLPDASSIFIELLELENGDLSWQDLSAQAKLHYQLSTGARDLFYRQAKSLNFRARSAFKLLQVDAETGILNGIQRAVDLCAAPGSWSQVLQRKLYPNLSPSELLNLPSSDIRIISVDLQEFAPLEGVHFIRGDITSPATADEIIRFFHPNLVDLVVSDGAPDVTGIHELDENVQQQLMLAALNITTHILRPGGSFCAKIFKKSLYSLLETQFSAFFESVTCIKPLSSRARSAEHFLVAKGFRMPQGYKPAFWSPIENVPEQQEKKENSDGFRSLAEANRVTKEIAGFLACGSTSEADQDRAEIEERVKNGQSEEQSTEKKSKLSLEQLQHRLEAGEEIGSWEQIPFDAIIKQ